MLDNESIPSFCHAASNDFNLPDADPQHHLADEPGDKLNQPDLPSTSIAPQNGLSLKKSDARICFCCNHPPATTTMHPGGRLVRVLRSLTPFGTPGKGE